MAMALEDDRVDHAGHARELLEEGVFVPEHGELAGARVCALEQLDHHRNAVQTAAPMQTGLLSFVKYAGQRKGLEYLYSRVSHDGTPL